MHRQTSKSRRPLWLMSMLTMLLAAGSMAARAQPQGAAKQAAATQTARQARIARGQYLVHHVAMCIECHTPRDGNGNLDYTRLLQGARIPVNTPFPGMKWAFRAPKIAGLPGGWTEANVVTFLKTGIGPGGTTPRPPMPPFRMKDEDARAVAAYLKSLAPRS